MNPNGYGSIPINTIFRGLFTSINPSYFDVHYRGTLGFDTLPNQFPQIPVTSPTCIELWCIPRSSMEGSWRTKPPRCSMVVKMACGAWRMPETALKRCKGWQNVFRISSDWLVLCQIVGEGVYGDVVETNTEYIIIPYQMEKLNIHLPAK